VLPRVHTDYGYGLRRLQLLRQDSRHSLRGLGPLPDLPGTVSTRETAVGDVNTIASNLVQALDRIDHHLPRGSKSVLDSSMICMCGRGRDARTAHFNQHNVERFAAPWTPTGLKLNMN